MTDTTSSSNIDVRSTGCVKWFNNKTGFGFITATSGDKSGQDIFVHHSAIKVGSEQYRYLVQGEYVEFTVSNVDTNSKHEFHAVDVSGINGGRLMCETRQVIRENKVQYKSSAEPKASAPVKAEAKEDVPVKKPRGRPPKSNVVGDNSEKAEWTQVKRMYTKKSASASASASAPASAPVAK